MSKTLLVELSDALADAAELAGKSTVLVNARRRMPASGIVFAPVYCNSRANGVEGNGSNPGPADSHEVDRTRIRGVEQVHDGSS